MYRIVIFRSETATLPLAPAPIIGELHNPSRPSEQSQTIPTFLFVNKIRLRDSVDHSAASASSSQAMEQQTFSSSNVSVVGSRESLSHEQRFSTHPLQLDETAVPLVGSTQDPSGSMRTAGGELDRIRAERTSAEQARALDLEMRRPEYLKRLKRFADGSEIDGSVLLSSDNERVGITSTPMKGRRIQLFDFQETSAESFEESLMTYGYGTFGVERTPQRRLSPSDGRSREAVEWLTNNPTAVRQVSEVKSPAPESKPEPVLSEKELKKRRRLEAFKTTIGRPLSKLRAVDIEGKGRVLVDLTADELEELQSSASPSKRRSTGRKKRGVDKKGKAPARRAGPLTALNTSRTDKLDEPHWPDNEFPWCLRLRERNEELNAEQSERLKCIERYLSRDTDSEEGEGDDDAPAFSDEEVMPSSMWGQVFEDPPVPPRRGRGKMVPLRADPEPKIPVRRRASVAEKNQTVFFPSDPADARAALLSKRSVRLLEKRRKRRHRGERDEGMACVCGQGDEDDGRPAVQCDECFTWHHLECIGVKDESELGDEDDPWYCAECSTKVGWVEARAVTPEPPSPVQMITYRQPTFVPTDDRPPPQRRSDIALYSSSPQQQMSPIRDWNNSSVLKTPTRPKGYQRTIRDPLPSMTLWDDNARTGPSTPPASSRHVRIYSTPNSRYEDYGSDETVFQTPSRSAHVGVSFTTPKTPSWATSRLNPVSSGYGMNYSGPFSTPRNSIGRGDDVLNASSSAHNRSFSSSYGTYPPSYDDTPIRRTTSHQGANSRSIHGYGTYAYGHGQSHSVGSVLDSPLAVRAGVSAHGNHASGPPLSMALEESPIVRSANVGPRAIQAMGRDGDEERSR